MNSIDPGRSGASVINTIRPPAACWNSSNRPSPGRGSTRPGGPRGIRLAPRGTDLRGGCRRPARRRRGIGRRPRRSSAGRASMWSTGAVISVGQSRAVPSAAWARTISATCSTVSPGPENECPHRPFNWMSQNAGATQSSSGRRSAGPSTARTESIASASDRQSRPTGHRDDARRRDRHGKALRTRPAVLAHDATARASSSAPVAVRAVPRWRSEAATNSRNSGWAWVGFDLNSGWNWTARNQGCSASLDDLDDVAVGAHAGGDEAVLLERCAVLVVELVAMAVPFVDLLDAVGLGGPAPGSQGAGPGTEPHRAAALADRLLFGHQGDHRDDRSSGRIRCCWRPRAPGRRGRTRRRALHPQADPEKRDVRVRA